MGFLPQVSQNQALVAAVQHVRGAYGVKNQAAPRREGFQQQVHLGVVPQGLEVAHPLHGAPDSLLVEDPPVRQGYLHAQPVPDQAGKYLQLEPAHDLHMDPVPLPEKPQLGFFLFQKLQPRQGLGRVHPLGKLHPVGHYRRQHRGQGGFLRPQGLSCPGGGEPRHRRQGPGGGGVRKGKFLPGVQPQLQGLFFQGFAFQVSVGNGHPHPKLPAGNPEPGQPVSLGIPGDLIDPGPKFHWPGLFRGEPGQSVKKPLHPA